MMISELLSRMADTQFLIEYYQREVLEATLRTDIEFKTKRLKQCQKRIILLNYGLQKHFTRMNHE